MDENPFFQIYYTKRADSDGQRIKEYLYFKFTQREVDNFYKLLASFEKVISISPEMYPVIIPERNIRRAVLSKKLSVFYRIKKNGISVVAILDNRMNLSKWP